jgi:hypothetical protein
MKPHTCLDARRTRQDVVSGALQLLARLQQCHARALGHPREAELTAAVAASFAEENDSDGDDSPSEEGQGEAGTRRRRREAREGLGPVWRRLEGADELR